MGEPCNKERAQNPDEGWRLCCTQLRRCDTVIDILTTYHLLAQMHTYIRSVFTKTPRLSNSNRGMVAPKIATH